MDFRIGFGQDSHHFELEEKKQLVLGGLKIEDCQGLKGNSDADVVLHAIGRALGQVLGKTYIGKMSDEMCKSGITDSREYLKPALRDLKEKGYEIASVGVTLECRKPKIEPIAEEMRKSIAGVLEIDAERVGVNASSGESLTAFGKGKGIQCFAIVGIFRE